MSIRGQQRRAGAGFVLLLLALLAGSGRAQAAPAAPPGLSMTVRAGYDGHYKLGEWFPVQVTLANTGQPVDATVQVEAIGPNNDQRVANYARPINLPAPARKQVTLYTYAASYQHTLHVRLLQGDTVLIDQPVTVDPLNDAFLIGVVSAAPDLLNALSTTNQGSPSSAQPATVAHLALDDLPASAPALGGLDALVFAGTDTSKLAPDAGRAVAGWVTGGGMLVVAGGAGGPATSAGLADLLPVRFGASEPLASLDSLARYSGGTAPPAAGALVSAAALLPGIGAQAVITAAGRPLLAARPLGAGTVLALALDPAQPPLKTWDQSTAFWTQIFAGHTVQLSMAARRRTGNGIPSSVVSGTSSYFLNELSPFDLPSLQLPPVWEVGAFLVLYVLVVGPINYLVLRRGRRNDLAWITIPGLILLFAVAAYVLGYQSKGGQLRLTTSTILRADPGAPVALANSFVGLFSPNQATYDLQFPDETELSEVNSNGMGASAPGGTLPAIYQGKPSQVPNLHVDTWTLRSFLAESAVAYPLPYAGQFRLDGGTISGLLANRGNTALEDVAVIAGNAVARAGTLAPGASTQMRIPSGSAAGIDTLLETLVPGVQIQSYPPPNSAEDRARRRRAALLADILVDDQRAASGLTVRVIGWSTQPLLPVQVAGERPVRDDLVLVTSAFPVEQVAP